MAEIGFYHLTRTGPDQALPQLLGRTLAAGQRAVVMCATEERVAALDEALWQCPDPDWLPHGGSSDGDADLQPIWLTTQEVAPNGAKFLFLVDGVSSARLDEFARVFMLFDGNDPGAVASARVAWTEAKRAGHSLTYWQQTERGWEKKS
jgi:DNA polymerase-3 subunit chi